MLDPAHLAVDVRPQVHAQARSGASEELANLSLPDLQVLFQQRRLREIVLARGERRAGWESEHVHHPRRRVVLVGADDPVPVRILRRLHDVRVALLRGAQSLFGAFALSDVPRDTLIAYEATVLVEDRHAAVAGVESVPVDGHAPILEIAERLPRRERGPVFRPRPRHWRYPFDIPARLADQRGRVESAPVIGTAREIDEAQVLVLRPVPIGRQLSQPAEARLALAKHLLRPLAVRDVCDHARAPARAAFGVAHDPGAGVDPARHARPRNDPALDLVEILAVIVPVQPAQLIDDALAIVRVKRNPLDVLDAILDAWLARKTVDLVHARRRENLICLQVGIEVPLLRCFQGERMTLLRKPQCILGAPAGVDIADRTGHAVRIARRIAHAQAV